MAELSHTLKTLNTHTHTHTLSLSLSLSCSTLDIWQSIRYNYSMERSSETTRSVLWSLLMALLLAASLSTVVQSESAAEPPAIPTPEFAVLDSALSLAWSRACASCISHSGWEAHRPARLSIHTTGFFASNGEISVQPQIEIMEL